MNNGLLLFHVPPLSPKKRKKKEREKLYINWMKLKASVWERRKWLFCLIIMPVMIIRWIVGWMGYSDYAREHCQWTVRKIKTIWEISISCCPVQRLYMQWEKGFFLNPTSQLLIVSLWQSLNNQGSKGLMEIKSASFQLPEMQWISQKLESKSQ